MADATLADDNLTTTLFLNTSNCTPTEGQQNNSEDDARWSRHVQPKNKKEVKVYVRSQGQGSCRLGEEHVVTHQHMLQNTCTQLSSPTQTHGSTCPLRTNKQQSK